LGFAAAAALAGCEAAPPPQAAGRDVVRPALRFALDVPAGWTVRDLGGDVVLEVAAPPADVLAKKTPGVVSAQHPSGPSGKRHRESFSQARSARRADDGSAGPEAAAPPRQRSVIVHVVAVDREGMADLAAWADAAIREAADLGSDLAVVRREAARLADGREALLVVLDHPRGVEPMAQRMLLAMTGRTAYALLATGSKGRLAAAEADVKQCFDTFIVW
jgi:hypothetical protein